MSGKENTVKGMEAELPEKPAKSKKKKKSSGGGFKEFLSNAWEFLQSEQGRKTIAISLILASVVLLVAIVSHFFTGNRDLSVVEGGGILGNAPAERTGNWLGSIGAWLGNLFVTKGFGLMAICIPVITGLWGFAMLENTYYSFLWKLFGYTVFFVLWGSATLGFFTHLFHFSSGNLAGGFGWSLNAGMFNIVGKVGMGLVLATVILIFMVVNFNTDFPVSRWLVTVFPFLKPKAAEGEGAEEGVLAEEGEEADPELVIESGPVAGMDKKKEDDSFILSVTKAGAEEPAAIAEADQEEETEEVEEEEEGQEDEISLDMELTPVTEEPVAKSGGDNLELEIEAADAGEPILDNIMKVGEETYEKIVPEEDLETVDDDEVLASEWEQYDPTRELSSYEFPPIELLKAHDANVSREVNRAELEENKNKIVRTLRNYKIEIVSIKATIGPTVTLYEIVPAPGVRISKIKNLEDDVALSLAALGIRIIAPIPGKGTIGIEIPNSNPEIVSMRSVLATEKFRDTKAELPIALGKTISNEVYIADLAKMPHLLIAGATGQGKSVGINGLISSILYKKHPSQVKFVLIDPKKVELNLYGALSHHFIAMLPGAEEPIITDTKQVVGVLNSICNEMDDRYDLLKKAKVRNLKEYNEKFLNRRLNPKKGHRYLPYIVLIIDEFADLMMTAGREIETPIARLAQLARAIGIHLVLATQRPSVNVITGIIKANFPARISYRVTSKIDSRTILDTGGADQLIGRGDLLLSAGSDLIRIQNAFIDTPEVEDLVKFISEQRGYPQPYPLPEVPMDQGDGDDFDDDDGGSRDAMFAEAARLVVRHQQGSTSLIQRRLKLGYNRAGRIIDQLEKAGVVGPFSGSKAREVLVHDEAELERILSAMV